MLKEDALIKPSSRLQNLPPYPFAKIAQQVNAMKADGLDVVRLDIGNPDLPPPDIVIEALNQSSNDKTKHGYTGYRGTPEFRQAVARFYHRRFGVALNPETEVLPLIGSKEGIANLALAFLNAGDIALIPGLGYPSYAMGALLAGAEVYRFPLLSHAGYLPELDTISAEIAGRAKLMWVNYPNNPTGATAEMIFYERLGAFCKQHQIVLASDNPYVDVTYDGYVACSALQGPGAKSCSVEFMSFSKSYNMAGWRLGAAVGNAEVLKGLLHVKTNVDTGHFRPVYDAGVVALDHVPDDWLARRNAIYQARRDRILAILPEIGLEAEIPKASLYIWARVRDGDGKSYASAALQEALVSVAPGEIYGPDGQSYVRLSLGTPDDRLEMALDRLKNWYGSKT